MNKKQWKAIYDYCADVGYSNASELLEALKKQGIIEERETFQDLVYYPSGNTYEAMMDWLLENLL